MGGGSAPDSWLAVRRKWARTSRQERKALVFLREGRVRVSAPRTLAFLPHAVEIRLRRRDPADQDPGLGRVPVGQKGHRVYVGIAAMREGQWVPEVDDADKTWETPDLN